MNSVLEVKDLRVVFSDDFGSRVITDDISFRIGKGETLGVVGESGCGKSVTSLALMGLLAAGGSVRGGQALFGGKDLLKLSEKDLDAVRGQDIAMIYQDALASLNPVLTIGNQMMEPLRIHLGLSKKAAGLRSLDLLARVGLPDPKSVMKKFPHELSGGMRQRVMIAMALSCDPVLLIADEPTTALDVTIQAQIMQMIRRLRAESNMAMMLITHDIGLVAQMADRVLVMYAGQIIEEADVKELFSHPLHPYTRALMASVPGMEDDPDRVLESIRGSVPENYTDMTGCRFCDRCPFAEDQCMQAQDYREVREGHRVRCRRAEEYSGEGV